VPPRGYGGTEWVVQQLCDGLCARGHQVTLYASGDSHTAADLRSVFPTQIPQFMGLPAFEAQHSGFALADILSRDGERSFDIIHDHSGFFVVAAAQLLSLPPVLHTVHGAFDDVTTGFYRQFGQVVAYNAVSEYQRAMGPDGMNWAGVVHNAIDLNGWVLQPRKSDYLLAFGRICEAKGFHLAIEVAQRTGRRLIMAGALQPQNADYFHDVIEPKLSDQVVFLGEVTDARRRELFADAAAFLFPILWPEPFGLVMIEALATGTPVIALRNGSVPEVIEDGVTGFIVASVDEMVAAVGQLHEIDSAACRRVVEQRFTVERLITQYETLYKRLLTQRSAT
jgi:glycosyltransferase involved in cell wall biosynthesis